MTRRFYPQSQREYTLELSPQAKVMNRWAKRLPSSSLDAKRPSYAPENGALVATTKSPSPAAEQQQIDQLQQNLDSIKPYRPISRDLYLLHQFPTKSQEELQFTQNQRPASGRHEISDQKLLQSRQLRQQDEEYLKAEQARNLLSKSQKIRQQEQYRHELDRHKSLSESLRNQEQEQERRVSNETFFNSIYQREDQRRQFSRNLERQLTSDAWQTYQRQLEEKKKRLRGEEDEAMVNQQQKRLSEGDAQQPQTTSLPITSSSDAVISSSHPTTRRTVEIPVFTSSDQQKQAASRKLAQQLREENYRLMQERKSANRFEAPQRYKASWI